MPLPPGPVSERTAADIATLLYRLDGLPLAIELAAARTRAMSPAEIVGRLEQRGTDALDDHDGDRPRSLRAILDWTLGLLSPAELETLEAVSVCAGSGGPPEAGSQSHVPRIPPQHPLELLARHRTPGALPPLLLRASEPLGAQALVEATATFLVVALRPQS